MTRIKPIIVIGLMGSGKTTVGRLLAESLELPLSDSDVWLREHYDSTAAQLATDADDLHAREAAHVLEAVRTPQVVAAAASVVEFPEVRRALHDQAVVVWLDAPDEILRERMKTSAHRPGFDPAVMRARRAPFFAELADLTVDVAANTPEQATAYILRNLALNSEAAKTGQ